MVSQKTYRKVLEHTGWKPIKIRSYGKMSLQIGKKVQYRIVLGFKNKNDSFQAVFCESTAEEILREEVK